MEIGVAVVKGTGWGWGWGREVVVVVWGIDGWRGMGRERDGRMSRGEEG